MNRHDRPRKRFGQHFLTCEATIARIRDAISPRPGETVVEIGPGRGAMTLPLARSTADLHAIEFDRDLVPRLREQFAQYPNVTIHEADALHFDFASLGSSLRIVGNLPYNISTPLLFHLIDFRDSILDLTFMLQKEVVNRLTAVPGTKAYGRLTIMAGCHLQGEALFDVPPTAFQPPPKVTSSVIRLQPLAANQFNIKDQMLLQRLVTAAFSQRRKTLRNSLRQVATALDMEAVSIDSGARAEEVPVAAWVALANRLSAGK